MNVCEIPPGCWLRKENVLNRNVLKQQITCHCTVRVACTPDFHFCRRRPLFFSGWRRSSLEVRLWRGIPASLTICAGNHWTVIPKIMLMTMWNGDVHGSSTAARIGAIGHNWPLVNVGYAAL